MQYRNVGSTGLKVSAVSIGGWTTFGGSIEDDVTGKILRTSIEKGINFVDLADVYARGEAEKSAGKALADFERSKLVISSKVFGRMSDDPNDRGLSRKHVMESVERSLKNLRTDYLDLYFCHREDPETPLEETMCAMDDLVHQGKILYWGTSVWDAKTLQKSHDLATDRNLYAPVVEQPRYSLLHREIESAVLPTAARLGMGLVVWSPLGGGLLTGKYNHGIPDASRAATSKWLEDDLQDANLDRIRTFCNIAQELAVEPGQLALAWALLRPEVASVITGATRPEHVESNVGAVDVKLDETTVKKLEELFPV